MFKDTYSESVASAQGSIDYALAALSHTHCPTWKGSATVACSESLSQIVGLGSGVYRQLHVLRSALEEIEHLYVQAQTSCALQGVG